MTHYARKLSAVFIVLVLVGGLLVTPVASQDAELIPVKQAGFIVTTLTPMFVAIENGYFEDEGLDVQFFELASGQLAAAALASGLADFAALGVEDVIGLQAQGEDVFLFYSLLDRLSMELIVRPDVLEERGVNRESPIEERLAALEGMTIGITLPGAPTDLYTRWMINRAGLNPDTDASLVAVGGGTALLAALETGQIDGYLLSPPTTYIAEAQGIGEFLVKSGDIPEFNFAYTSMGVNGRFAAENPDAVIAYSRAMDRAYEFIVNNPDEAVELVREAYFPDSTFESLAIGINATVPSFDPDGTFTEQSIINQGQILVDIGELEEMPDTSEGVLWTNEYNPETIPQYHRPEELEADAEE